MSESTVLAAEWVIPVEGAPFRDGVVVVEGTDLAWVGPRRELPSRFLRVPFRAFPRAVLLPGWVNAHCHLNLTAAMGMLPGSADRFTDWVRLLLQLSHAWTPEVVRQSVVAGLDLLASTGTTTVAHVTTLPGLEPLLEHPMRSVVFHEPIGFPATRAAALLTEAEEWLDAAEAIIRHTHAVHVTLGVAPHAPYSVSPELYQALADLSRQRGLPYSTHLSETRAEAQFVADGSGQFQAFLEERGAWDPQWHPAGASPVQYLERLGVLENALAVHGNYLSDQDLRVLRERNATVTWCPGSHRFFGHSPHPAERLLDAGVKLALGTDSLASNHGLSMLREVRLAAEAFPRVSPAVWIQAATLGGAAALGLGHRVGSLTPGKAADLQVLGGLPEEVKDPQAALLEGNLRVRLVMVDGAEMKVR